MVCIASGGGAAVGGSLRSSLGLAPLSPMTVDVFVFFSKNTKSVKLLRWDTDGFLL